MVETSTRDWSIAITSVIAFVDFTRDASSSLPHREETDVQGVGCNGLLAVSDESPCK